MFCENCGKEHDGSYGSGRFCCKSCAVAFGNKQKKHSEETKKKISESLRKHRENNISSLKEHKDYKKSFKHIKIRKTKYKKCSICGREYLYIKGNHSHCENEFCKIHNIQHFRSLIKYFGFDKNKLGTVEVEQEFDRVRSILFDLYWNQNKSSSDLALMFNYNSTPTNITQKFFKAYLNIPVKSVSEATVENFLVGKLEPTVSPQYKSGWHTTWNNKEVYLRSSYELDYAKQLDEQKIDYEVENLRIKYWDSQRNDYRCAIPDFYVPSKNLIVEIKCDYSLDKQNMKDKRKAYIELGYKFKCICEHKEIEI